MAGSDAYYIVEKLREPPYSLSLDVLAFRRAGRGQARRSGSNATLMRCCAAAARLLRLLCTHARHGPTAPTPRTQ